MTIHLPTPQASTPRRASNMQDVLDHVLASPRYAEATRTDYASAIKRCVSLYNANRLADVPADLAVFQRRWPSNGFDPLRFKSRRAYQAWRRKGQAILREYFGEAAVRRERRSRDDDWTLLIAVTETALTEAGTDLKSIIPIRTLADMARRAGLTPVELTTSIVAQWAEAAAPSRRQSLVRAVRTLEALRGSAAIPADLFPATPLEDIEKVRRAACPVLPAHLAAQAEEWIAAYCDGEKDFVTEEVINALSSSARGTYQAAMTKYLGTALATGAISPELSQLAQAMTPAVLREVLRAWVGEDDPSRRISERSMNKYIRSIRTLMAGQNLDTREFEKALATTKILREGHRANKEMSPKTRQFCSTLVQHRDFEMIFRSMHRRCQRRAQEIIAKDGYTREAIQLGTLAAFFVIELWGVPLRLGNFLALRIRGEAPTLILPQGKRDYAMIILNGGAVKNGKPVRARIPRSRAKALEVLDWYLDEIRPHFPKAAESDLLVPGWKAEKLSQAAFRNWMQDHTAELGLPMRPHNARHGQASLYLKDNSSDFAAAARLLGNGSQSVRTYYGWIDEDAEMDRVQRMVATKAELM